MPVKKAWLRLHMPRLCLVCQLLLQQELRMSCCRTSEGYYGKTNCN